MRTKIRIHLKDDIKEIKCHHIILKEPIIEIDQYQKFDTLLLEAKNYNHSRLNINNIKACRLVTFNSDMSFVVNIDNLCRGDKHFSLLIPDMYMLIIPNDYDIDAESIIRFEIIPNIHTKFNNQIKFITKRELIIKERSIVINVDSIEELFPGGFKALFSSNNFHGITNGYIVVLVNRNNDPYYFEDTISIFFEPYGFKKNSDYYIIFNENSYENKLKTTAFGHVSNYWLNFNFNPIIGSCVWHSSIENDQMIFIENYPMIQCWTFWYSLHPILKNIKLKTREKSPAIRIDDKWLKKVSINEYINIDKDLLPLLIDSQFSVRPNVEKLFPKEYNGYVILLSKSMFLGVVACISVHYIENGKLDVGDPLLKINNNLGRFRI